MKQFDIKVLGALPAVVMACLLMTGTCSPLPDAGAANQGDAEKQISPRLLASNQNLPEAPTNPVSHPNNVETVPAKNLPVSAPAVAPPSLPSVSEEQSEEDLQTQMANGDQFVKEVLRQFFDKLRKRPMLVEEILKHETYKQLMRDRNNLDSGNAAQQSQPAIDEKPKWQYIPVFTPEEFNSAPLQQEQTQQQQQQQIQPVVQQQQQQSQPEQQQQQNQPLQQQQQENPALNADLSQTVKDSGELDETQKIKKEDSTQQQEKLRPEKAQQQQQQPTEKSKLTLPNMPNGVVVETGPESYYLYPLVAPNKADASNTGTQTGTGSSDQETSSLYDTEMPAYYYYFYYDDALDAETNPADAKNTETNQKNIPDSNNNKQNANEISSEENNVDKAAPAPEPTIKQTKGDTFAGESPREPPPSDADISVENELTKLHN